MTTHNTPLHTCRSDAAVLRACGGIRLAARTLALALVLGTGLPSGASAAAPAPPARNPATAEPDADAIQQVFNCMSEGLPEKWQHSWVIATETRRNESSRDFEAVFRYAEVETDTTGTRFAPCGSETLPMDIIRVNAALARQWREIRLDFYRDGRFELRYDNPK